MVEPGNSCRRPSLIPVVIYQNQQAALTWLEQAFGFEVREMWTDAAGKIAHVEMGFGDGLVIIGSEFADYTKSPKTIGGSNTQCLYVHVETGIDAHCERARQAGAVIAQKPTDQFYGERTYRAIDLEGHVWTFSQTVRRPSTQEMEAASGLTCVSSS